MKTLSNAIATARIARLKLFLGSALIFASVAAAGQAGDIYPRLIEQARTANVVRPVQRLYSDRCTQLEKIAKLAPPECGTLTAAEVVQRLAAIRDTDKND